MTTCTDWSSATPEQRGRIREEIWRVLQREGRRTQTALMHRLALPFGTVGEALKALTASGAVTHGHEGELVFYTAVLPAA